MSRLCIYPRVVRRARLGKYLPLRSTAISMARDTRPYRAAAIRADKRRWVSERAKVLHQAELAVFQLSREQDRYERQVYSEPSDKEVELEANRLVRAWEKNANGPAWCFWYESKTGSVRVECGPTVGMTTLPLQWPGARWPGGWVPRTRKCTIMVAQLAAPWRRKGFLARVIHGMLASPTGRLLHVEISSVLNSHWLEALTRDALSPSGAWKFSEPAPGGGSKETRGTFYREYNGETPSNFAAFRFFGSR